MRQGRTTLHFERGAGKAALKISDTIERLFRTGKDLDMTGISFHKLAS